MKERLAAGDSMWRSTSRQSRGWRFPEKKARSSRNASDVTVQMRYVASQRLEEGRSDNARSASTVHTWCDADGLGRAGLCKYIHAWM